jgi:Tol biopolymer transport system component
VIARAARVFVLLLLPGCPRPEVRPPAAAPPPILVATERGPRGGRLVLVDLDGSRTADLTPIETEPHIDSHPALSPDGRIVVFASTRERPLSETSLWQIEATPGAVPLRVSQGPAVDRDPVWLPDGHGVIFARNAGTSFDLFRLPFRDGAFQSPVKLTSDATDELSPSPAPDGRALVYMALDRESGQSSLRILDLATGQSRRLTPGPGDVTPAWSPDGKSIAYAAPAKGRDDLDLFVVSPKDGSIAALCDESYADQTGPAWSGDGRFVFATSLYRAAADGTPILSSIVVLDRLARPPLFRVLHDPAAVASRLGVAVGAQKLSAARLEENLPYIDGLRRALVKELERSPSDPVDTP